MLIRYQNVLVTLAISGCPSLCSFINQKKEGRTTINQTSTLCRFFLNQANFLNVHYIRLLRSRNKDRRSVYELESKSMTVSVLYFYILINC